jgi:hypothetical protein
MPTIYVKPSPGGRVRMPERNFMPMPEAGAWVPRVDFYERLLIGGDVIECDPPVEPSPVPETPASVNTPKVSARGPSKEN